MINNTTMGITITRSVKLGQLLKQLSGHDLHTVVIESKQPSKKDNYQKSVSFGI